LCSVDMSKLKSAIGNSGGLSSLISIGPLEGVLNTVVEQQNELAAKVQQLEARMGTMATQEELTNLERTMADHIQRHERQLEKLEASRKSSEGLASEVPKIKADIAEKLRDLENRLTVESSKATQALSQRLQSAETELAVRALSTDLRKLAMEVDDRTRKEDTRRLQETLNRVRDDAHDRLDDIAERTFQQRKELDDKLNTVQAATNAMQQRVDQRTDKLEEQSSQVNTFIFKAERSLNAKVSFEELDALKVHFLENMSDIRQLLTSQMALVQERAEHNDGDVKQLKGFMESAALRKDVEPLARLADHLRLSLEEFETDLKTRALAKEVQEQLDKLAEQQEYQLRTIKTKADAETVQDRHENHVVETSSAISGLKDQSEQLGASINMVEEQIGQISVLASEKADRDELDAIIMMSQSLQTQVSGVKGELQNTLTAIEVWMLEQGSKRSHGMKLQTHPSERKLPSRLGDRSSAGGLSEPQDTAEFGVSKRVQDVEEELKIIRQLVSAMGEQLSNGSGTSLGGGNGPAIDSPPGGTQLQQPEDPLKYAAPLDPRPPPKLGVAMGASAPPRLYAGQTLSTAGAQARVPGSQPPQPPTSQPPQPVPPPPALPPHALDDGGNIVISGGGKFGGRYPELQPWSPGAGRAASALEPQPSYQQQRPPRKRYAGGVLAKTHGSIVKELPPKSGDGERSEVAGPPFRSDSERRQWLLQEKRRWIVEMRLGHSLQDPAAPDIQMPTKLPPVASRLSNGMQLDTIATPR